jgi:probable HAF family extracellular repeat protein
MGMSELGTLGGYYSRASGINDAGQVVGGSYTADGNLHAFITGPDGEGMVDLNSLVDLPEGVILTQAAGINNNGQVIAMGVIPEPETYALMLAGLGLVGFMARRKKMENLKRY